MKRRDLLLLFFALSFVATACSNKKSTSPEVSSAELGSTAPDFTLKDLSGRNIALSDYRGKVVLLEFWAMWCPPCKASIPALLELEKKYKQKGFIVLGVSLDTDSDALEKLRQFSVSYNINYPVLLADDMTPKRFDVMSIPTSFLIGKDGKIVDIYKGYSHAFNSNVSAQIERLL